MIPSRPSERGQALVLIMLAIVGVFGFSALAIDGGMLYAERRRAQNAADTSVFAAAMTGLEKGNYVAAGLTQASMNGFVTDGKNQVSVNHPPASGIFAGNNDYYQVIIKTEFSPFFAQFVYSGTLQNTVEAVARAKPSTSLSPGNAVHATSKDQCHALWFQGSSGTIIKDGGIYSNSSVEGTASCSSILNKNGDLTIQNGSVTAVGGIYVADEIVMLDELGNPMDADEIDDSINDHITAGEKIDIPDIAPPVCTGMTSRNKTDPGNEVSSKVFVLQPGIYPSGISVGNDEVHLNSGIYCLDGDLSIDSGSLYGEQVLIYMRGPAGDPSVSLNGGGTIVLTSPTQNPLYDNADPPKAWSGMVIFMLNENGGSVDFAGGGASSLWGTIYAPGPLALGGAKSAKCDITGNSESFRFRAQLICNSVRITGNGTLEINYKEAEQYHEPPTIELSQ